MCWNERVSWLTFLIGSAFSLIGISQSKTILKTWLHLFFQLVLFVQFGEALVWRDGGACKLLGQTGSAIAFFSVWLQPILGLYILHLLQIPTEIKTAYILLLLFYVLFSVSHIQNMFGECYQSVCEKECVYPHLEFTAWGDISPMGLLYMISILILLFYMYKKYPYVSGYVIITMILSGLLYKNSFGSMWCWFGAFTPLIAILYSS